MPQCDTHLSQVISKFIHNDKIIDQTQPLILFIKNILEEVWPWPLSYRPEPLSLFIMYTSNKWYKFLQLLQNPFINDKKNTVLETAINILVWEAFFSQYIHMILTFELRTGSKCDPSSQCDIQMYIHAVISKIDPLMTRLSSGHNHQCTYMLNILWSTCVTLTFWNTP